jgi:hypothetical protein
LHDYIVSIDRYGCVNYYMLLMASRVEINEKLIEQRITFTILYSFNAAQRSDFKS